MKSTIFFSLLSILLQSACSQAPVQIAQPSDYSQYMEAPDSDMDSSLDSDIAFWQDRFSEDPSNEIPLVKLAQLFAPLTPFFSELTYQELLGDQQSVHLTNWPLIDEKLRDEKLEQDMGVARQVVEAAHAQRKDLGLKVRQPLAKVMISSSQPRVQDDVAEVLLNEINVKSLEWTNNENFSVKLDTQLTPELKEEGEVRELMRSIQQLRKEAGVQVHDFVVVEAPSWPAEWEDRIKQKTKLSALVKGPTLRVLLEK